MVAKIGTLKEEISDQLIECDLDCPEEIDANDDYVNNEDCHLEGIRCHFGTQTLECVPGCSGTE